MRGLTLRVSDAYAPQPLNYGLPQDDLENLVQSNRLEAQARYRRELPDEFVLDLTLRGTRFDSDPYQVRQDPVPAGLPPGTESFNASYDDVTAAGGASARHGAGGDRLRTPRPLASAGLTIFRKTISPRSRASRASVGERLRNVEVELGVATGKSTFTLDRPRPGRSVFSSSKATSKAAGAGTPA